MNEFKQSKFLTKTKFLFNKDSLEFTLKEEISSSVFVVKYNEIDLLSAREIKEKTPLFLRGGLFFIFIAGLLLNHNFFDTGTFIILGAGIVVLLTYIFYVTEYTVFNTSHGGLVVIKDKNSNKIISRIQEEVKNSILAEHGQIDYSRTLEEEKTKFRNLFNLGFLDEAEYNQVLTKISENSEKFKGVSKD
jgi:hypothetical protein